MQSKATTVTEYLAELPPDRRQAIAAVRKVILDNLDNGFEEGMQYGMIGYYVPHRIYPAGYHCNPKQPLPFACLASQKNYMSIYLMTVYGGDETWFREQWARSGKKLDMGKSCIRFKKLDDLALDVIGAAIRRVPLKGYIAQYEAMLGAPRATKQPKGAKASRTSRGKSTAASKSKATVAKKRARSTKK